MTRRLRAILSGTCFGIGTVWAVAAALKMIFGVAITLPILPPLALERVDVARSLVIALVWFAAGAVVGRYAPVRDADSRLRERAL
jgi:hypothetical protein